MNPFLHLAYRAVAQAAQSATALLPSGDGKVRRSFTARRGVIERFAAWGAEHRDPNRPLIWLHAPSVGEGLQGVPVFDRLRLRRPELQTAWTFFSPSAERFAQARGADIADFLPFDTPSAARTLLDALRPSALVFSKLDVWPELVAACAARGVPTALISATLPETSSRRHPLARALLHESYRTLSAVGAISREDGERLVSLGVRRDVISVTGDTRYDQVWARTASVDRSDAVLAPLASTRPTLVAGSTWPADEGVLFEAWATVRAAVPNARLIIAPHEPTAAHCEPVMQWAAASALSCARLGTPEAPNADVVLVDRVGVLGNLYAIGTVALVGGGFHAAGLHSVLEPAAFGCPIVVGPRDATQRDATLLLAAGGLVRSPNAAEMAAVLVEWLSQPARRASAGSAARGVVARGLGAADRATELVLSLLR